MATNFETFDKLFSVLIREKMIVIDEFENEDNDITIAFEKQRYEWEFKRWLTMNNLWKENSSINKARVLEKYRQFLNIETWEKLKQDIPHRRLKLVKNIIKEGTLNEVFWYAIRKTNGYNRLNDEVNSLGVIRFILQKENSKNEVVNIFSPELAYFFSTESVVATVNKVEVKICGKDFIKHFIDGYKEAENEYYTPPVFDPNTFKKFIDETFFDSTAFLEDARFYSDRAFRYDGQISIGNIKSWGRYTGTMSKVLYDTFELPELFADFFRVAPPQIVELPKETTNNNEADIIEKTENNYPHSYIEACLEKFKAKMSAEDYATLVTAIKQYFDSGTFPTIKKSIKVGKVNVKAFAWVLHEIHGQLSENKIPIEYMRFAKQNISSFANIPFDENNYQTSRLYKYFHTKTQ